MGKSFENRRSGLLTQVRRNVKREREQVRKCTTVECVLPEFDLRE
jgi:hypothetical protein